MAVYNGNPIGVVDFNGQLATEAITIALGSRVFAPRTSVPVGGPFLGMTNGQIVHSLSPQQLNLLRQWMGTGAQGARQALGRALPEGLTAATLRAYKEVARRQIAAGLDTVGTQAARLALIEQALRALGQ